MIRGNSKNIFRRNMPGAMSTAWRGHVFYRSPNFNMATKTWPCHPSCRVKTHNYLYLLVLRDNCGGFTDDFGSSPDHSWGSADRSGDSAVHRWRSTVHPWRPAVHSGASTTGPGKPRIRSRRSADYLPGPATGSLKSANHPLGSVTDPLRSVDRPLNYESRIPKMRFNWALRARISSGLKINGDPRPIKIMISIPTAV